MIELKIDAELRDWLPKLTADERANLRDQIMANGCTDPIVTWNGTIVDGHNRYEICRAAGLPFQTIEIEFEGKQQALAWITQRQGGRRNVSPSRLRYIRGKTYLARKCSHGAESGTRRERGEKVVSGHDVHLQKSAELVAKEFGVNEKTIRRDAKFAEQVDALPEPEKKAILNGERRELPVDQVASQVAELLARLERGPATKECLLAIAGANFTKRISDLRAQGKNIKRDGEFYVLANGKPKKSEPRLPKQFRYEKPQGTDAALQRMQEIVKEAQTLMRGGQFQANHFLLLKLVSELGELIQCFDSSAK